MDAGAFASEWLRKEGVFERPEIDRVDEGH
jgi:hypothetical protein